MPAHAARHRRDPGRRGQRGLRQPAGVSRHRRSDLGRQLPRRARRAGRRRAGRRDRGDRQHQRAPQRAAGRSYVQPAAGVPGDRPGAGVGLHDRASDRGRPGLGEQRPGASRQRRLDSDLGRSGGPRLDGNARRTPARRHDAQLRQHRGGGIALRHARHLFPPPAAHVGRAGGRAGGSAVRGRRHGGRLPGAADRAGRGDGAGRALYAAGRRAVPDDVRKRAEHGTRGNA